MGEIKNEVTTANGAVELGEEELGEVTGGVNAMKIPDLFGGAAGIADSDGPIKNLKNSDIRLPKGSIRAGKIK